ncbi:Uncharacterised protein [Nocardia otitidiscaviarum]|uniref:Uncharacterized protein n=1 Tax=Nocardia otitidiscaviarum TaxID=1823 RepID=A0A378YVF8_9NOCA|nr:hypothetical protein [Nocardia otitidiscaviarum]SUA81156.1 Uncharacterised protein [Nocardia otitidiscaviarum]
MYRYLRRAVLAAAAMGLVAGVVAPEAAAAPNLIYHKVMGPNLALWGFSDQASCWQHLSETPGPHLSSVTDCEWRPNSGQGPDARGKDPAGFYIYTANPSPV